MFKNASPVSFMIALHRKLCKHKKSPQNIFIPQRFSFLHCFLSALPADVLSEAPHLPADVEVFSD
jgi:hypothetical protein